MLEPATPEPTFDRLLQVAVEVFAELGFRDATVREICARANVNVASVNYYFRSKQALYRQALIFAFQQANRRYPQEAAADARLPAEQRLVLFIESFIQRLLDDNQLGRVGKMITREIADPTQVFDDIVDVMITPQCRLLEDIVRQILPNQNTALVERCVLSILGQCLLFKHSRSVIERLYPHLLTDPELVPATAGHIAQFSLLALQALRQISAGPAP